MRAVALAALVGAVALSVGYASSGHRFEAGLLALVPMGILVLRTPVLALPVSVALLPYTADVSRGHLGGVQVTVSEVLLLVAVAGVVIEACLVRHLRWLRALIPLRTALVVYFGALLVAFAAHPSAAGLPTIVQRIELLVVSMLTGAYLVSRGRLALALELYVIAASVLAVATIATTLVHGGSSDAYLGLQKNPAGQAMAVGLLITIATRSIHVRWLLVPLLAVGLLASLSRGAILATAISLVLFAILQAPGKARLRALALLPLLGVVSVAAYSFLPSDQQSRLVTVSPTGTDYSIKERGNYADAAIATFKSAPVLGTGVGPYLAGTEEAGTLTDDPHDVVLLEAAEGGVVLAAGFIFLALSSWGVLLTRVRRDPLVLCALAVQVSTVLHGLVDVYWVRGTPVMGWLLVGAALATAGLRDAAEDDADRPVATAVTA